MFAQPMVVQQMVQSMRIVEKHTVVPSVVFGLCIFMV
jgi:hypothetical protein